MAIAPEHEGPLSPGQRPGLPQRTGAGRTTGPTGVWAVGLTPPTARLCRRGFRPRGFPHGDASPGSGHRAMRLRSPSTGATGSCAVASRAKWPFASPSPATSRDALRGGRTRGQHYPPRAQPPPVWYVVAAPVLFVMAARPGAAASESSSRSSRCKCPSPRSSATSSRPTRPSSGGSSPSTWLTTPVSS